MDPALEGPLIDLDTVPEAYVRLDSDFRFTFVKRAALSLLGKVPAELLGKKLWDVYLSSAGTPLDLGCRRTMATWQAASGLSTIRSECRCATSALYDRVDARACLLITWSRQASREQA
jgi:PAS domain-containing protein